ncbi:hypothetical protein P7H71_00270 [Lactococcus lactis]|uniref:hypothetical protein n=1 Tax=Lactococcus lactis TaxID=1358 RepID=UPI00288DAA30|nr:hypothetical protein [Lactococcus lactis]MDT2898978.1 hypothetical protein [Lactococcus lactis]
MKNENFVQIPNKMFTNTNNDEKLVYVKLLQSQMIGYLDKDNRTTTTTIPTLVALLGWSKGKYSNKKVVKALNGLKEKDYINFESTQDVFTVQINKWNDKEEHIVSVDWKQSGVKFSGHTQIKYSVIDNLLEGKDFTLYSYAEYRTLKNHQYRICYEEWGLVLEMTSRNAFNVVNSSEVIIKVTNGYDSDTKRQETNSYLTFDSFEDIKEVSLKPTYKDKSKSVVEEEPEQESVEQEQEQELYEDESVEEEDDFYDFEEEELSLKAEAKKPVLEANIKPSKAIKQKDNKVVDIHTKQAKIDSKDLLNQIKGNTIEANTFRKMQREDKRVTTLDESKQIQDFDVPMSISMFKVIETTDSAYIRDCGAKKLKNKKWKDKFGAELDEEIHKYKESEHKTKFMSKFLYKTITEYYEDGGECVISSDKLYDYVHNRMVYSDDEYTYFTPTNMVPHLKCIKVTEKY